MALVEFHGDPSNGLTYESLGKRYHALISGQLAVDELDNEELSRGVPRTDDGGFHTLADAAARSLPQQLQNSIKAELYRRAEGKLHSHLLDAIDSIVQIATDGELDKDRLRASQYLLERVMGKTPEVVHFSQEKPWQMVLEAVETSTRKRARAERGDDPQQLL